jgi:hypothetical protein
MLQGTLAQVSNRSTFELIVKLFDEDGQLMDLSGLTIVFAMCPRGSTPYWWGDTPNTASLVASTTPGQAGDINIIDLGVMQIVIPASAMKVAAPADYDAGLTAKTDDTDICQVFVGGISIVEGVVTSP